MGRKLWAALLATAIICGAAACCAETAVENGLKIRPGMTAFSTLKGRQEPRYTAEDVAGPLTENCPDLLALDLGHNNVSDLSFITAWPKLRRLIVVDSKTPVTDLSPLEGLEDLEYVELFMQGITDISPLAGKTSLKDLNLAHNDITDLTPLYSCTGLQRLWINSNPHLSKEQVAAFREAVPGCKVNTRGYPSTGMGWREHPHYTVLMDSFRSGEYIPFEDSAPLTEPAEESETGKRAESADEGSATEAETSETGSVTEEAEQAAEEGMAQKEPSDQECAVTERVPSSEQNQTETAGFIKSAKAETVPDEPLARDISAECLLGGRRMGPNHPLTDGKYGQAVRSGMKEGVHAMVITAPEGETIGGLSVRWEQNGMPLAVEILNASGEWVTAAETDGDFFVDYIPLPGVTQCRIRNREDGKAQLRLVELTVLTAGRLPENIQVWQKPDKVDLMLIAGHPDDELLWFGGLLPYYAGQLQKRTLVICCAMSARLRQHELCDALWACGVRVHPVYLKRLDFSDTSLNLVLKKWHAKDETLEIVTGLIRRHKPEVLVLQDVNGEYGHGIHKAGCWLGREGSAAAADPQRFPEQAESLGVWEIPKVYIHLWPENQIRMDWKKPLSAFGGKTGLEAAQDALQFHRSQVIHGWTVTEGGEYDNSLFGLYHSSVGPDEEGNDLFEHIVSSP